MVRVAINPDLLSFQITNIDSDAIKLSQFVIILMTNRSNYNSYMLYKKAKCLS